MALWWPNLETKPIKEKIDVCASFSPDRDLWLVMYLLRVAHKITAQCIFDIGQSIIVTFTELGEKQEGWKVLQ